MGAAAFANGHNAKSDTESSTKVYLNINGRSVGEFNFKNQYREGLDELIKALKKDHQLFLLSGDNDAEKNSLIKIFGKNSLMYFNQTPTDKLNFIDELQQSGKKVIMIGDGLNDAGALKKSNVGIAVSEQNNNFTPVCDAILDASQINRLGVFIEFSKSARKVILISFLISLMYNAIGLSYAVSGTLSPVIAAILMPLSSITIIMFTTIASNCLAYRKGLLHNLFDAIV